MSVQRVSTGYIPRPLQAVLHSALKRFNVLVCHRRFGKTVFAVNELVDKGLRNTLKNPQYAFIAPTYGQAKRVAWDLLKDTTKNLPGVITNETDMRVDIPRPALNDRIRIMLLGAENPSSILGMYLDGVVLDEYGDMNPVTWTTVIRPMLTDRLGWAIFIGTPKGENHFYKLHQYARLGDPEKNIPPPDNWFTKIFKASETGVIPKEELDDARATMSPEEYEQDFECSFTAALLGAYYGKEMEKAQKDGRITDVVYDPAVPVTAYWDLGIDDMTSIWFGQKVGRENHWIDYLEVSGLGLPEIIKEVQNKGYVLKEHVLPHDAAARELGTGKSREETIRALHRGVRCRVLTRQDVADGINAARLLIATSWFDEKKCFRGISCLKNYQRVWDAKNQVFQARPKHDWASHGADAFRYAAMAANNFDPHEEDRKRRPRQSISDFPVV